MVTEFLSYYFAGTTAPLYLSLMKSWISLDYNTSIKALIFSSSLCPFELRLS